MRLHKISITNKSYTMDTNKTKKTLKEKLLLLREQIKRPVQLLLALLPILGLTLYALPFPMINLWDLFVEYTFGSFWIAVFFIALIYFILLMLGGISYYTVIIFMLYYFTAMAIGYGYPLITVGITVFALVYMMFQIFKLVDNR